jgi:DNA-binding transcriptional ArsR family regulator
MIPHFPHLETLPTYLKHLRLPLSAIAFFLMIRERSSAKKISDSALDRIALEFQVLSDATRLRLLNELRGGEKNVTDLIKATRTTQSNVSKQLALLYRAGLIARRKAGLNVFYSISDPTVNQICDLMCAKFKTRFEHR